MGKVDVAVQSYKKPESLIFTLLTLHRHSKDCIDTIWINDDQSNNGAIEAYNELKKSNILDPWNIKIRVNTKRVGWWISFAYGRVPKYVSTLFFLKRMIWNFYKNKTFFINRQDFRYQWAIESTDKAKLMIIHDDVAFLNDVVSPLRSSFEDSKKIAISGDLGQCWRCRYKELGCTPAKVLDGYRPDKNWPLTKKEKSDHKWACRVNEWVAMIDVGIAKDIAESDNVFFGNCDDAGDTGAYWFSRIIDAGYGFKDPLSIGNNKEQYYKHWEGGITGHSAWVDQGSGQNPYNPRDVKKRIYEEFGYEF